MIQTIKLLREKVDFIKRTEGCVPFTTVADLSDEEFRDFVHRFDDSVDLAIDRAKEKVS